MTEILPDTIRRLYTDPAEYIDSDHPAVVTFAEAAAPAGSQGIGVTTKYLTHISFAPGVCISIRIGC